MTTDERFDIEKVTSIYHNCKYQEDDILLQYYLQAYEEINKFFLNLGTVFGFVSSDVRAKLNILYKLIEQDDNNFRSIRTMMEHEKESGLLNESKYVSGCRTLLRLHRGLEFVYEFLKRLADLNENDKTTVCCQNAYNDTLSKHHSWMIRKGAVMSMYALPTQGELLKRVCTNASKAIETLPEMLSLTRTIYDRTQNLYEIHSLQNLP